MAHVQPWGKEKRFLTRNNMLFVDRITNLIFLILIISTKHIVTVQTGWGKIIPSGHSQK